MSVIQDNERHILKFLKSGDVLVDCGGNIGEYSKTALKIAGNLNLTIFEANPELIGILNDIKKINKNILLFSVL